ncbi:unnamed protein product [Schistosoma curassoni]|uniref:Uncharacterized protein n=1 Tax=Schistosoma curassoni TaxID=6186 RepID=A0A183K980_9TREM|nr:unnamed protein product [Schistosoma curassoni]
MQWTSRMQLDNLDFADDLAFLSQSQQQMQEKTISVAAASAAVQMILDRIEAFVEKAPVSSASGLPIP